MAKELDVLAAKEELAKCVLNKTANERTQTEGILADTVLALIERLQGWKKAVEGLTPSGSEFVDDPKACGDYVRERMSDQHRLVIKTIQEKQELAERADKAEAQLASLREKARKVVDWHTLSIEQFVLKYGGTVTKAWNESNARKKAVAALAAELGDKE